MSIERIEYKVNPCPVHYRDDVSKMLDENYDAFSYARKGVVNTGNSNEDICLHHLFFLGKMACHISGMSLEESIISFFKDDARGADIENKANYDALVKKGFLRKEKHNEKDIYFPTEEACKIAHLYDKKRLTYS